MKQTLLFLLLPIFIYSQTQVGDIPINAYQIQTSSNGELIVISENVDNYVNVKTYTYENSNWVNGPNNDISGLNEISILDSCLALSQDGNFLAVGSSNERSSLEIGVVKIFENINNQWVQVGGDLKTGVALDGFGASPFESSVDFSFDGSIIAIGARRYDHDGDGEDNGFVRVFQNTSGSWNQLGSDIIGDNGFKTGSGLSLSEDGLTMAVGSGEFDNYKGQIKVYKFENNNWVQLGNEITGDNEGDFVGYTISLSADGNRIAFGARNADNGSILRAGYAKVYENVNNEWVQIDEKLTGVGNVDYERFGNRIILSADGSILTIGSINTAKTYKISNNSINDLNINLEGHPATLSADGSNIVIEQISYDENTATTTYNVVVYNIEDVLSNEKYENALFSIYPNPSNNKINITTKNSDSIKKVNIYTIDGKNVMTTNDSEINISYLTSGTYIVEIETLLGKSSKKLIVE